MTNLAEKKIGETMTETTPKIIPVRRALISVSDKSGVDEFATGLAKNGVELISTGGTAQLLRDAGLSIRDVAEVTGSPEMMDGRVKTLHPNIHGGILADRTRSSHISAMEEHNIPSIDLVVVNLYPFEKTILGGADAPTAIENIDIGGPAMIRAAAKNHQSVGIVTDPEDYDEVLEAISAGGLNLALRKKLAAIAFARTSAYDSAISHWFAQHIGDPLPRRVSLAGKRQATLRYGENPHQSAAFYTSVDLMNGQGAKQDAGLRPGVATARQIQGKELSYNNLNDTDAAYELAGEIAGDRAGVAIIKHANPCGVALGDNLLEAYKKAYQCDPVSAFGGVIAMTQLLNGETAEAISSVFTEVIIAPDADDDAIAVLSRKKNLRLLLAGDLPNPAAEGMVMKPLAGGFLFQSRDSGRINLDALKVVTKRQPTEQEWKDMIFSFQVAKHVKSNAIVYVRDEATVGIGAGQMSRVDSSRIAARKAKDAASAANLHTSLTEGSVVASDAFFPFADGLEAAIEAGATAVIQPGGSIRDEDVIAAADKAGVAMVFTGMRHFRH
ncbi:MAG: bifunctional phosphoribosylaminoimidazolecarboxamide formyltransferase/IMP cyclohydrolase [Pseudomonadota bacterium]